MEIIKNKNGSAMCISLAGRLETTTAPQFDAVISGELGDVTDLTIDLEKLDYISSAGLRVLLSAQKKMNRQGTMRVLHPDEIVAEIFDVTGFAEILTIE